MLGTSLRFRLKMPTSKRHPAQGYDSWRALKPAIPCYSSTGPDTAAMATLFKIPMRKLKMNARLA